ncbi:hypothetical protein [Sphingomonas sp. ABOLF]|uniref:hypothetical protein n=1 Tax=Sphingomonas sp. ABOLF TaxID=1985879 RepID=UPI000F7E0005|nr:hypothetical protein [Sphingomonas sp. ABOLF]
MAAEDVRGWRNPVLVAIVVSFIASRLIALVFNRDPWLDEAMLLANMPLSDVAALFRPLPLYEQASPLGYTWLLSLLVNAMPGEPVLAGRLLSACASLCAGAALYLTVRRAFPAYLIPMILALALLTPYAVRFGTEIKHYEFELLSTTLMAFGAYRTSEKASISNLAIFAGACLFGILFSFTAPISIAACGAGILFSVGGRTLLSGRPKRLLVAAGAAGLIVVTAFVAYYLMFTKPVSATQFAAYAYQYEPNLLDLPPRSASEAVEWLDFPMFLFQLFGLHQEEVASRFNPAIRIPLGGIIFLLTAFGVARLWVTARFFSAACGAAVVIVYLMGALRLLPFIYARHFISLIPILAVPLAVGVSEALRWLTRDRIRVPAMSSAVALAVAMTGLIAVFFLPELDASTPVARYAQQSAGAPIWISPQLQPTLRNIAPSMKYLGEVDPRSTSEGWRSRFRRQLSPGRTVVRPDYVASFAEAVRKYPTLWILTREKTLQLPERAEHLGKSCALQEAHERLILYRCSSSK